MQNDEYFDQNTQELLPLPAMIDQGYAQPKRAFFPSILRIPLLPSPMPIVSNAGGGSQTQKSAKITCKCDDLICNGSGDHRNGFFGGVDPPRRLRAHSPSHQRPLNPEQKSFYPYMHYSTLQRSVPEILKLGRRIAQVVIRPV